MVIITRCFFLIYYTQETTGYMYRDMTIHETSDGTHDIDMMRQGKENDFPCVLPELNWVCSLGLFADDWCILRERGWQMIVNPTTQVGQVFPLRKGRRMTGQCKVLGYMGTYICTHGHLYHYLHVSISSSICQTASKDHTTLPNSTN